MSDHDIPGVDPRVQVVQFDHDEEAADAAAPDELSSGGPKAGQPLAYGGAQARQSHAAGSRPGEVGPSSITNDPGSRSTTRSTMRRQLTLTPPPSTGSRSRGPRRASRPPTAARRRGSRTPPVAARARLARPRSRSTLPSSRRSTTALLRTGGTTTRRSRRPRYRSVVGLIADTNLEAPDIDNFLCYTYLEKFLSNLGALHHLDNFMDEGFLTLQDTVDCMLTMDDLIELHIDARLRLSILNSLMFLRHDVPARLYGYAIGFDTAPGTIKEEHVL